MKLGKLFLGCFCLLIALPTINGCSSSKIRIVEQSDSKPNWASVSKTTFENDGKKFFVGYFTADGDARPSAAIAGAGTKAMAMPMESLSDEFLQQSGVADDLHDSASKMIISTLRKNPPNIPGLQVTSNYYERVEIPNGNDDTVRSELRVFSLAQCSIGEYNTAKRQALLQLKKDSKLKKELDEIMVGQRSKIQADRNISSQETSE